MHDGLSGREGSFSTDSWDSLKGVASISTLDALDFGDYDSECLSDPSLCQQGLSLSFWLRHKRKCIFSFCVIFYW